MGKEQLDADIMKVSQILQKLKDSPEWKKIPRVTIHKRPDGVLTKVTAEYKRVFNLESEPVDKIVV